MAQTSLVDSIQITDRRWVDFISNNSQATIFHHSAWASLLAECYGYRPLLWAALNESGQILAGLPLMEVNSWLTGRRMVALPFSDFCPPIAVDDAALSELVQQLQTWRRQHNLPQVDVHWPLLNQGDLYPGESFIWHVTHLIPDHQKIFRSFKKTRVQQPIRQAERAGVIIKWGENWDDLHLFYNLHLQTRRRLGAPIQPLRFFQLLWERLLSQDLGFVLLAYQGSQLLAGAIFLYWNEVLTYKYSASDSEYWHLRPNNLLLWHAIRWGCEHGYQLFDWGKTDPENKGLRNFKRGWGSEEQALHYSVLADRQPSVSPLSAGYGRRFISTVIQRSPGWVCRVVGELLYGHFA